MSLTAASQSALTAPANSPISPIFLLSRSQVVAAARRSLPMVWETQVADVPEPSWELLVGKIETSGRHRIYRVEVLVHLIDELVFNAVGQRAHDVAIGLAVGALELVNTWL